jgi:membrane protein DedA with SNARE-associated domain
VSRPPILDQRANPVDEPRVVRAVVHPLLVLGLTAVARAGVTGYVILYFGVAASWVGIPIIGASFLAAAGVLASEGELNLWLVMIVATIAAWTGGYVGYLIGARARDAVSRRSGRWQRQRQRALNTGERIYRRWGRLAVFVTPTWVSGALGMSRDTFLAWNALAALVSTLIATLGAYGIGSAILGQLSARRGTIALVVAALTLTATAVAIHRRHRTPPGGETK